MDVNPRYVINTSNGTAKLELFVASILVTTYAYANNEVLLEERPNIDVVTLQQLKENIDAINLWSALVKKELKPPAAKTNPYSSEMQKEEGKLKGMYNEQGSQVTDAEYLVSTALISFQPRSEMTMNFFDYCGWAVFLDTFYRQIRDF